MVNEGWKDNILISSEALKTNNSGGDNVMLRGSNSRGDLQNSNSLANELELLVLQKEQQHRQQRNLNLLVEGDREFGIHRSGSAPPTVEGAFNAVGSVLRNPNFALHDNNNAAATGGNHGVLTEEEIRSHPSYLAYYYSNENLNPRLPPPLLSREDWRIAQRVQAGGSSAGAIGDLRNTNMVDDGSSSFLLPMQPRLSLQKAEDELIELRKAAVRNLSRKNSTDYLEGSSSGMAGMPNPGMGTRKKSFADIVQEGRSQPAISAGRLSRPASQNSVGDILDTSNVSEASSLELKNKADAFDASHPGQLSPSSSRRVMPGTFTSNMGSSLGSPPGFPTAAGRVSSEDKKKIIDDKLHDLSSHDADVSHILASFPGSEGAPFSTSNQIAFLNSHQPNLQQQYFDNEFAWGNRVSPQSNNRNFNFDRQANLHRKSSSLVNLQSLVSPEFAMFEEPKNQYRGSHLGTGNLNGLGIRRGGNLGRSNLHPPDVHDTHNLERSTNHTIHAAAMPRNQSLLRSYVGSSHPDLRELERMYIEALLAQQQQVQFQLPLLSPQSGNSPLGQHMYQGNRMTNLLHPTMDSGGYNFLNGQISRMPRTLKSQLGGSPGSWSPRSGTIVEGKLVSSLLEELKNSKGRSLELSDVIDHIVEFSMDQYGSRFIQQKLETASTEEKIKIFPHIIPHARGLMTDVFGNYVIQKFFEHGTESQRKDLANQIIGHVLPLSLQMYGCRVIQKALEVVDIEQQTQMVSEVNGSVMKCVHDQNGNHVIQKCIECIPQDKIQFIVSSFYGQVVTLSTHPYGCRVIQRVLEHCIDPKTQQIVMDEIMKSVCALAQDQYGNYVIQHVLQHGKPHERSEIIAKLAGQIVKMSQQKFASNVIEKCLTFGGPEQRQLLISEMLGSTDENEPLQAMMKDPFGNYVVQKVLETCDDESRELIIARIKVHLNTLKKYTYGKHIVSRVEKLIATGEKHMGASST
ncbi:OLC1v1026086C1 [Oldenlandia corymbosa var. corymbosa]|uniref:OLC1v1026086C1 n=1 Tax=Oldenlandia corymbosa var. corymbosa TaxID=529605 RepID=A0AAV1C9L8_OLDCO|nr:OLC1v1026086C1 [Oldenlandia corymbosa var. corymbosa]